MASLASRYPTAFVTGAADGLGRAMALMLAAEGVRVWATSRRRERLAGLLQAGGDRIRPVELELADPDGAEAALRGAAEEAGGTIDLLVNNAGFGVFGEFGAVAPQTWEAQLAAMLGGSLRLAHVAWNGWRRRGAGGALVNVSSLAAEFPIPFLSGYNAAKAGLSGLSESLMAEARGTPLVVIDFRPGDYRTGFNRAMEGQTGAGPARSGVAAAVWQRLEAVLAGAPAPEKAARDLRRALRRGRSATVRSGDGFQAWLAPLAARALPLRARRALTARYFRLP